MKRKDRTMPQVSTASLPDIIFMLLFFFMVVTVLRKSDISDNINLPNASNPSKIKDQSKIKQIMVTTNMDDEMKIYMEGSLIDINNLENKLSQLKSTYSDKEFKQVSISLHVDRNIKMGILNQIKTALRKSNFRKVTYVTTGENI